MSTLTERLDKLPETRRLKIEERAQELITEELSLREPAQSDEEDPDASRRTAGHQPGERIPYRKADRSADIHSERLRRGDGGRLRLVAEFPDRPPIALSGIGALDREDSTDRDIST